MNSDAFMASAPHDAGTAIGAAFAVHRAKQNVPPQRGNYTPYSRPAFKRRDILAAVKSAGSYCATKQVARVRRRGTLLLMARSSTWFQGSHGVRATCAG